MTEKISVTNQFGYKTRKSNKTKQLRYTKVKKDVQKERDEGG